MINETVVSEKKKKRNRKRKQRLKRRLKQKRKEKEKAEEQRQREKENARTKLRESIKSSKTQRKSGYQLPKTFARQYPEMAKKIQGMTSKEMQNFMRNVSKSQELMNNPLLEQKMKEFLPDANLKDVKKVVKRAEKRGKRKNKGKEQEQKEHDIEVDENFVFTNDQKNKANTKPMSTKKVFKKMNF